MTHQATRNKRRGADFECDLLEWVQAHVDPHAVRPRLNGTQDMGDIAAYAKKKLATPGNRSVVEKELRALFEAKTAVKGRPLNLSGWWKEAEQEVVNANADFGVLVVRRYGKPDPGDAWAVMPLAKLVELLEAT